MTRRRVIAGGVVCALLGVGGLAFFGQGLDGFLSYRIKDGTEVRSPSLGLDLREILGFQEFHAQLGQDKWVAGVVHPGVRDGYFVDVGAWDAVSSSNTKALEDLGWRGVCVEPFPRNWRDRTCQLFREVVYSVSGETVRFHAAGVRGGVTEHVDHENSQVRRSPTVELTTTTLADILERANAPGYVHYVNIDVEGAELEVLKGFPFDRYRVGAFTIEHNHAEPRRTRIRELLESKGYRHAREQAVDDWYVLSEPSGAP